MQESSDKFSENDLPLLEHSLLEWGLSEATVKNFQDNEITFQLLDDIREFELKELIPSIKERILFRRGLHKLNEIVHDTASEETNSICSVDVESSSASSTEFTDFKTKQTTERCKEQSDLKSILKTTTCGELCLASVNKSIDMTLRNHISKTIVEYYIKQYGSMSSRDFDDMSSQITVLFPSECKETYYVPSRKYSAKSYIPARGKLVDRYHNQKRTLRKTAVLKTAQNAVDKIDSTEESGFSTTVTADAEEIEEHQLWLKFNKEPFVEILEKWHKTRAYRMEYLACHENTIHDILSEWPSLKLSLGYKLIETDFDAIHPHRGLNLLRKWPTFMDKALPHLKKLKSSELNILDENPVEDARNYIYFKLMAHKMPPTVKVPIRDNDKKKKLYKPSIVESQNAFILHVTNQSEIKNKLDQCQKVHLSRGTTFQPLIIVVGPTSKDIQDFYVAVECVLYKMDSVLKAVDVCFKVIHVLNAQYPTESISIWTFIQKYFYDIDCKTDKKTSSVSCFLSDLL